VSLASKPYRASGGESELRTYGAGERLQIEAQEDGYVVAWSAEADASTFMRAVGHLIDASAETELSPPHMNGRKSVSFVEADAAVASNPDNFRFIVVESADSNFSWSVVNPATPAAKRDAPGQVVVAFRAFDEACVVGLIEKTATPHVRSDVRGIVESAERLTHSAPSTSA
jgi:hypothetical protein